MHSLKQLIHIDLLDHKGTPLSITFIYGQPELSKREKVWLELKHLKYLARTKWLCIGDFNQILSEEDKFAFLDRKIMGADIFQQTLNELGLCELEAKGQKYTWMNKREDESFVMERLDSAFTSVDWIYSYPQYALHNQPILRPDHGAILLDFEIQNCFKRRPFRFEKNVDHS